MPPKKQICLTGPTPVLPSRSKTPTLPEANTASPRDAASPRSAGGRLADQQNGTGPSPRGAGGRGGQSPRHAAQGRNHAPGQSRSNQLPPIQPHQRQAQRSGRHQEENTSTLDRSQLSRKLSFIDISIDEVTNAIKAEEQDWKVSDSLWYYILVKEPASAFRVMQNKSLTYWIGVFNRWQDLGGWNPERVAEIVDAHDLPMILDMELAVLKGIIMLFDPEGYRKVKIEGPTNSSLAKVRINICEMMTAGVMLSRSISTKHKLRFVFGLVDVDDSRSLDERQFACFISAFINGLGCAFGIAENKDVLPTESCISLKANRLYSRISSIAAQRIKDLHAAGSANDKAQLIAAIKQRQSELIRGSMVARRTLIAPDGSQPLSHARKSRIGIARQVLRFQTLQEWCFRVYKDPLALPYALCIERFRSERYGDVADEYDEVLTDFYLSHKENVPLAEDDSHVHPEDLLVRAEVTLARRIYESASLINFRSTIHGLEKELEMTFEYTFRQKVDRGLVAAAEARSRRTQVDFFEFLEFMCPNALPKHIHMFMSWCKQFDDIAKIDNMLVAVKECQRVYNANNHKPVLPLEDIRSLDDIFDVLTQGRGHITADDLMMEWGWDYQTVQATMKRFDIRQNGKIDKTEFMRMMCPDEYRLPEMAGYERKLFGKLLEDHIETVKRELHAKECLFGANTQGKPVKSEMPDSALPDVEEEEWERWNAIFDELDRDRDDLVTLSDMEYSGWLSRDLCQHIMTLIDPDMKSSFTRRGFLSSVLKVCGRKRKGFTSSLFTARLSLSQLTHLE